MEFQQLSLNSRNHHRKRKKNTRNGKLAHSFVSFLFKVEAATIDSVGTRVINSDMSCYGNNLMLTSYINVQLVYEIYVGN